MKPISKLNKKTNNNPVLQNLLDELAPYLQSLQIDPDNNFKPILTFIFPINWEIGEMQDNYGFELIEETDDYVELAFHILKQELNLDNLYDFIRLEIIRYNKLLEEKQEELTTKIRKIQEEKEREIETLKYNLKMEVKNNNIKSLSKPNNKNDINVNIDIEPNPNPVVQSPQINDLMQQNIHEILMQDQQEDFISDDMVNLDQPYQPQTLITSDLSEPMIVGGVDISQFVGKAQPIKTSELFKGL